MTTNKFILLILPSNKGKPLIFTTKKSYRLLVLAKKDLYLLGCRLSWQNLWWETTSRAEVVQLPWIAKGHHSLLKWLEEVDILTKTRNKTTIMQQEGHMKVLGIRDISLSPFNSLLVFCFVPPSEPSAPLLFPILSFKYLSSSNAPFIILLPISLPAQPSYPPGIKSPLLLPIF